MLASVGIVAAILGGLFWLRGEAQPGERDYHAVRSEFERIEREIHEHDIGIWIAIEGEPHDQGPGHAEQERRHARILEDFRRLSRAKSFSMSDVDIEVEGDRAHLTYALQVSADEYWQGVPTQGTMEFVRKQGAWVLDDHHFVGVP